MVRPGRKASRHRHYVMKRVTIRPGPEESETSGTVSDPAGAPDGVSWNYFVLRNTY